jgi:hypothetical protein
MRGDRQGGATRRDVKSGRSRPALRFPVFPPLPWTILFDEGLRLAITFEEHTIWRTTKPVMIEVEQTHKGRAEQFMPLTVRAFSLGGRHASCRLDWEQKHSKAAKGSEIEIWPIASAICRG